MGQVPTWPWVAQGSDRIKYVKLALRGRSNGGKDRSNGGVKGEPRSGPALNAPFAT